MKLLVSVRSANEALAALAGGSDLIDIKEPANGPLGEADEKVMAEILQAVAGRAPVSAAFGELNDLSLTRLSTQKLDFVKAGLAGCRGNAWREKMLEWRSISAHTVVPAAYGDSQLAEAPNVEEVVEFVIAERFPVLLIDTFKKCGQTLFDHLPVKQLAQWAEQLRTAGVKLALAGSLAENHVASIRIINPNWMAVRGAVCRESLRAGEVDLNLVRSLKGLLGA